MAITINIYYTGLNGNARKFAEEMIAKGVVEDIRAKDGNLQYEYFLPMEDPETILLIDKWKNQEALDLHHSSPAIKGRDTSYCVFSPPLVFTAYQ